MEGWEGRERMGDRKDETAAAVEPKGERLPQWKQTCDPGCPQTRPWLQQMLTVWICGTLVSGCKGPSIVPGLCESKM